MRLSRVTIVSSLAVASAGPLAHEQDSPAMVNDQIANFTSC